MRYVFALLLAPLLLAPVRLKDATPGFFTPPAQSPAPESYSLPPADPLVTPTSVPAPVIPVKPNLTAPVTATVVTSPTSLNLPLPTAPAGTTQQVIIIQQPAAGAISPMQAALCIKGMQLVQELSLLSYQQRPHSSIMRLSLAAATAGNEAASGKWPNLAAFYYAAKRLPWFSQPHKTEIQDATRAAARLCEKS